MSTQTQPAATFRAMTPDEAAASRAAGEARRALLEGPGHSLDILRQAVEVCPAGEARTSALDILATVPRTVDGPRTLRAFLEAVHGRQVHTFQVTPWSTWAPGPRTVEATRATFATLDGSRRTYTRQVVQASSARAVLIREEDEGHVIVCAYVLADDGEG